MSPSPAGTCAHRAADPTAAAERVIVTDHALTVELRDGRRFSAPIGWYPRLVRTTRQVRRKLGEYFAAGVLQVWVIDPASRTVQVHHGRGEPESLAPGAVLTGGDALPGFRLPVDDIFE